MLKFLLVIKVFFVSLGNEAPRKPSSLPRVLSSYLDIGFFVAYPDFKIRRELEYFIILLFWLADA